jgi:hypothetical protein
MDDLPDILNRLATRLETLEQRVYALEHPSEASRSLSAPEPGPSQTAQASETLPFALAGGAFSVLGKAMLGIAGAYLLRALAESSSLPKLAVAALAIAYAMMWLVWSARAPAGAWFASITYACTSALILAPMLWELTLRFKAFPAAVTAGVLAAFVCAASALAWKRNLTSVLWVANVTGVAVALTLSIASHEMEPFIAALLVMALICEYAAERNRERGVRILVALAADLGVWALIYIYSSPQGTRTSYPELGTAALLMPGFTLFLIFGASAIVETVQNRNKITSFETIQAMIAFLLAACSLLYFGPTASAVILGVICVALSAACYAATFISFDRAAERRNYRVFAAWSAALFVAGSLLCLPPLWKTPCLGAAAIAATALGARLNRRALECHGMVYLLAAAVVSGLLSYIASALVGTLAGPPAWSVTMVSACAVLCYAGGKPCRGVTWKRQLLPFAFASLAIGSVAALTVEGLVWLTASNINSGAYRVAFIRTLTLCLASLALAFSGSHWRRMELTWISYAALALVAAKLVLEELRLGHLEWVAASIFIFAVTLIAVSRIARMGQKA